MQKITFQNLPSTTTPINATNLNAIQTNAETAINSIDIELSKTIDMFNDTSGNDWQEMMRNKLQYCISNYNTTKENAVAFINGGWSGHFYGNGLFSKIGNHYQLIWMSNSLSAYCLYDAGNNTYDYGIYQAEDDTGWQEFTLTSDFSQTSWNKLRYRKKNGIVYIIGTIDVLAPTTWTKLITTLPQGYRPIEELNVACRTSWDPFMKIAITANGEIETLNLNDGGQLTANTNIFINCSFIADN